MSGTDGKKPGSNANKAVNTTLSDILDFGPDNSTTIVVKSTPDETQVRLKKLVKDLQTLNVRVDRLSRLN